MIRTLLRAGVSLVGLGTLAYAYFFVPLGSHTLWEHTQRIAATPEAQELGDDVGVASDRVGDAVRTKIGELSAQDAGANADTR